MQFKCSSPTQHNIQSLPEQQSAKANLARDKIIGVLHNTGEMLVRIEIHYVGMSLIKHFLLKINLLLAYITTVR
jgi:hypothetical protein